VLLKPAKVIRFKSDIYDSADLTFPDPLDPFTIRVELPIGVKWPTNIVNDSIKFEDDGYTDEFIIESRTDQILIAKGGGLTPGVEKKWVIFGFNRQQRAEFKAISVKFTGLSREGNKFQKESSGGNE
jgi:hypothetical protein